MAGYRGQALGVRARPGAPEGLGASRSEMKAPPRRSTPQGKNPPLK
jgi:hypothetical protein